jgi:hypothetical protein
LLDLLLADRDLVGGGFVIRLNLLDTLEVFEGFFDFAESEMSGATTVEGFDVLRVEAEGFVALEIDKSSNFGRGASTDSYRMANFVEIVQLLVAQRLV